MSLERKFNRYFKNVPKTVFPLQVGFTDDFVPDCPSNYVFDSSNLDTTFDYTNYYNVFL